MGLIFCVIFETATTLLSMCIASNEFADTMEKMGDIGIKVKEGKTDQVVDFLEKRSKKTFAKFNWLKAILPIYNIMYAIKYQEKRVNENIRILTDNDVVVPFTREDFELYDHSGVRQEKIQFILNNASVVKYIVNGYDEDTSVINENKYKEKRDISKGKIQGLFDIDEVEALASTYNYDYRIGYIEDKPTAIIGVYDIDMSFDLLKTSGDEYKEYKQISNQEARNLHFNVYKFTEPHNEKAFEKCLETIKKSREMVKQSDYINSIEKAKVKKFAK